MSFSQHLVDMLGDEGVLPYLDDLLLHSSDPDDHLRLLKLVFQAHQESGIKISAEKTHLFRQEVEYLGHLIWGLHCCRLMSIKLLSGPCLPQEKSLQHFWVFVGITGNFCPALPQ